MKQLPFKTMAPVAIFLLGGGGTGKTTLMDQYVKKHHQESACLIATIKEVARSIMKENRIQQACLQSNQIFWDLQLKIARKQVEEERRHGRDYISDRCVIDALVYASLRFPDRFPSLMLRPDKSTSDDVERSKVLALVVGDIQTAHEVLGRYRQSLMVLVHPFSDKASHDDGVRLVMNREELGDYTTRCRQILLALDIAFVEMKDPLLPNRLCCLETAIIDHRRLQTQTSMNKDSS